MISPCARNVAVLLAMLLPAAPAQAADTEVDLELVLAVDVSRSMDQAEQELQKAGYAAALRHPEVLKAIASGFLGRIAVTYVEWAGPGAQSVVAPWTAIAGAPDADRFAALLATRPESFQHGTSISGALAFSNGLFDGNGFTAARKVIDVSGDGPNNMGAPVLPVRDAVLASGVTVNGLPIMLHDGALGGFDIDDLDRYYADCVIGGPGAFIVPVETLDAFAEAVRRKLVLEIARRADPGDTSGGSGAGERPLKVQFAEPARGSDCLIGEKLRRRWMDP